jgi:hypothetical protein
LYQAVLENDLSKARELFYRQLPLAGLHPQGRFAGDHQGWVACHRAGIGRSAVTGFSVE